MFLQVPKCGPRGCLKTAKSGHWPKCQTNPYGRCKNCTDAKSRKTPFLVIFRDFKKNTEKPTFFSDFSESGQKCQKDPRFSGLLAKSVQNVTNKTLISVVFVLKWRQNPYKIAICLAKSRQNGQNMAILMKIMCFGRTESWASLRDSDRNAEKCRKVSK